MHDVLLKVHRWAGLIAGIVILLISVTGCILVFENDIERALNAHAMLVTPGATRISLRQAADAVRAEYPVDPPTSMTFPERPTHALLVNLKSGLAAGVDPYTGQVLGTIRRSRGPALFVHLVHTRLAAGEPGENTVGAFTVMTLFMALSGVYLWWPRRIWSLASGRSWRRANFDLHNVLGLYSALFLVVMTVSGVMIAYGPTLDGMVRKLDGPPRAPSARMASRIVAGAAPLSPDEAVRIAGETLPGAFVASLNLPPPGVGFYRMTLKFPEDHTPAGRSRLALDQYSGHVLDVQSTRQAPLGTRILNLKRSIHTGDVFGAPSQALAFLVSLSLAGQVVTGFLIWWRPGKFGAAAKGAARKA